jgi:hypothetical protein
MGQGIVAGARRIDYGFTIEGDLSTYCLHHPTPISSFYPYPAEALVS